MESDILQVRKAMLEIERHTCVRFVQRTTEENYVEIINNEESGCWSHVGRNCGKQQINLPIGCLYTDMQQKSMGHPDPEVGEMVARMNSNSRRNPEEMGTYYEGDILAPMDMTKN
ncbi:hypothetical protein B566_EDAN018043, partial [Ephemera danica]